MLSAGVAVLRRCYTGVTALNAVLDTVSVLVKHRNTCLRGFPYVRESAASFVLTSRRYRAMTKKRCCGVSPTEERRATREKACHTSATPPQHLTKKRARNPVQHAKTAILGGGVTVSEPTS